MITSSSDGLIPLGISPVRGTSKLSRTPLKFSRRKASRKDQATDVHSACSTPVRLQTGNPCTSSSLDSPVDSFPSSQDNRPDVIWDYTSPKLSKGTKKREIKITVDEFLKSINHNQNSECNTQNSHYIRLLEKWMVKQNTPVMKKPARAIKRDYKMRSRRVFEEIKHFMESMQPKNEDKVVQNSREVLGNVAENTFSNTEQLNQSTSSVNRQSFLEGDKNENDSLEELWGEADNSFIVKATQHLEVSSLKPNNKDKNVEVMSTIPETIPDTNVFHHVASEPRSTSEKDCLNKAMLDSDYQAQLLLTQIMSCDWESDSDFEDFENGFIMDDDALSLIPDEILSGTVKEQEKLAEKISKDVLQSNSRNAVKHNQLKSSSGENGSCEISFGYLDSDNITPATDALSEIELFNNFEDESFGDESILCKPEVLSWIDEVENKLSQSQKSSPELSQNTICTAKEIERKKDEAMQRLKRNQLQKKQS